MPYLMIEVVGGGGGWGGKSLGIDLSVHTYLLDLNNIVQSVLFLLYISSSIQTSSFPTLDHLRPLFLSRLSLSILVTDLLQRNPKHPEIYISAGKERPTTYIRGYLPTFYDLIYT